MDHLREVEVIAVRDAIDLFQTAMEVTILDLLDKDPGTAIAYLQITGDNAIYHIKGVGDEFSSVYEDTKAQRIAIRLIEKTVDRLCAVLKNADNNGSSIAKP
jgi:hypothetical protein